MINTTFNNFKNAFFSDNSAITNVEKSERTIKFGVYQPLTGPYKDAGNQEKIGIELANELYPEVLGRKIELVYADNQGDMYVAETVIKELIAQEPSVILGSYGETVTLVAGDFVKEAMSVMTHEQRNRLRSLLKLRIQRHSKYNLPQKRLRLIEKQVIKRVQELLGD